MGHPPGLISMPMYCISAKLLLISLSFLCVSLFTMEHNLVQYQAQLHRTKMYCASPGFSQSVGWRPTRSGHVLMEESASHDAVASVVGWVIEKGLDCELRGNFSKQQPFGSLATAKFQLHLAKPIATPFAEDFDITVKCLGHVQETHARTTRRPNFIIVEGSNKYLRFARSVFERRVRVVMIGGAILTFITSLIKSNQNRNFFWRNCKEEEREVSGFIRQWLVAYTCGWRWFSSERESRRQYRELAS